MPISAIGGPQAQYAYLPAAAHAPGAEDEAARGTEAGRLRPQESQPGDKDREYTEEQLAQIRELKARDQEVRQHEAAHKAAAGALAGAATFSYTRGPDGRMYATGGEVSIDTSTVPGDPQATINKMRTIHAAATAPIDPSSQDRRVAAQAMMQMMKAQQELMQGAGDAKPDKNPPTEPSIQARSQAASAYQAQATPT